jgi:hypothetical protein
MKNKFSVRFSDIIQFYQIYNEQSFVTELRQITKIHHIFTKIGSERAASGPTGYHPRDHPPGHPHLPRLSFAPAAPMTRL